MFFEWQAKRSSSCPAACHSVNSSVRVFARGPVGCLEKWCLRISNVIVVVILIAFPFLTKDAGHKEMQGGNEYCQHNTVCFAVLEVRTGTLPRIARLQVWHAPKGSQW
jgi:hypothetical protein